MGAEDLKKRTQAFAVSIVRLVQILSDRVPTCTIGRQLLRAGTSVGSNFRAACRARSHADFIAKLKIVEEECDESIYWLELLDILDSRNALPIRTLGREANEILSIVVASIKTARKNN